MADRVVAFAGSLRRGSLNRAMIHAARELAPDGMTIEPIEIADGILIAAPEYNDGIPGVLTNAIDWGSRLPGRAPLRGSRSR